MFLIETVSRNQTEILNNIIKLYCPLGFDLDPTYSRGVFYKGVPQPKYKFDLYPQLKGVIEADCRHLPVKSQLANSVVFDPPFVAGSRKDGKPGIIKERFGYYRNVPELWAFYRYAIKELYRVLKPNGILVFKCQDTIEGSKQFLSHFEIISYALTLGFYPLDLFVLLARSVLVSPNMLNQQHARKAHSYFLVFQKTRCPVNYVSSRGPL